MGAVADARALLIGSTARWTVRYGDGLRFSGTDLPAPRTVRVPTRHGPVRCLVHDAPGPRPGAPMVPLYVHVHGGAFVTRFPEMDDFFTRLVVAEVGATVVSVDYDVAPRRRYPVAHEQVQDVVGWVGAHAGRLAGDPSRIAVGGFSAGGNLAAAACLARVAADGPALAAQLLVVPSTDVAEPVGAKRSPLAHPMVSPSLLRLVRATYFRDAARRDEPQASPLRAVDLTGLPPTMVVTAELDALRAEGDAYASRLLDAGVPVRHLVVPRRDHYVMDARADRGQARAVLDAIVTFLREALGPVAPRA